MTIRANPFAIGQLASGGIPSGAFPFEISRDLVEGERFRFENAACEYGFLDFHCVFGLLWRTDKTAQRWSGGIGRYLIG